MTEIIFLVENDPEGGYVAKAANTIPELREMLRDAILCYYPAQNSFVYILCMTR